MARTLRWTGGVLLAIAAVVALAVGALQILGWNVLRGPIATVVTARTGRPFAIHGDLDVDLGLTLRVTARDLELGNPPWVDPKRPMLRMRELDLSLRLPQLLRGRVVLPRLMLDQPQVALLRRADGKTSWQLGSEEGGDGNNPPRIRELVIRDGQVELEDAIRGLNLQAAVSSSNRLDAPLGQQLRVTAEGRYNGQPFRLTARGGSLFALAERGTRYPVALDVRAGDTRITLKGSVGTDAAQTLDARLTVSGPDTAELYGLLGVVLPNSPPYSISGQLRHAGNTVRFDDLSGKIGDSDLAGSMRFDTGGPRVRMTADLRSQRLDFDDLGSLLGAPPATGNGETASPEQKVQATQLAQEGRLLPDAPLHADRLRAMDADVRYLAASVDARTVPLKDVRVEVQLKDGVLRLSPASFSFPQGNLELWLTLDGTQDPAATDLDVRLSKVLMDQLTPQIDGVPALAGTLDGRASMAGRGNSVRDFAAHANGRMGLAMNGGRMSHLAVELVGLDVAEALGVLIGKDKPVDIRCAAGALALQDGRLRIKSMLIDTEDSLVIAGGGVDLATERLDLKLQTHSKDASLLSGQTPVTLSGPLRRPAVGIESKGLAARGAAALALGAVLTPVAAMLAFIDPGLAQDSDCAARLREAGAAAADAPPVR